jgi:hypothetical protein
MSKLPSIFISSTIFDFRDLRSSLKFYLQTLGYEVYLSEFNDFPKPLDQGAYEAAITTLRSSDYFILLIGSRVGGLIDLSERISITRNEYRTAYEEAKNGKLRLLLLVREEIWNLREDRKALSEYLKEEFHRNKEFDINDIIKIQNHSSQFVNDAELIFEFIDEISRNEEIQKAIQGHGEFPKANWVHRFSTFQDIVDILRLQLGIKQKLSAIALRINLKRELLENLLQLTNKHRQRILPNYIFGSSVRKSLTSDIGGTSHIQKKELRMLVIYSLTAGMGKNLSDNFIEQSLESGEFLVYDKRSGEIISGLFNDRLFQLREQIRGLISSADGSQNQIIDFIAKYSKIAKGEGNISVPNLMLVFPLALADREHNVINLSIGLLKALEGDESMLETIQLIPSSPFNEQAKEIQSENPNLNEIEKWIGDIHALI